MAWPTPFWEDGRAAATPPPHPPARLLCSVPGAVEWNTAQCKRAAEPRAAPEDTGYLSDVNEALRKSRFCRLSCWSYLGPSCPDLEGWPSPAGWQISPGNGSPPGTQWQDGGRGGGGRAGLQGAAGSFPRPPSSRQRARVYILPQTDADWKMVGGPVWMACSPPEGMPAPQGSILFKFWVLRRTRISSNCESSGRRLGCAVDFYLLMSGLCLNPRSTRWC